MRGHRTPPRDERKVDAPLSPRVVEEIGVLNEFPPVPADYDPEGEWTHNYRIWGNHGTFRMFNKNLGHLIVSRAIGPSRERFQLSVTQEIVNADAIEHVIKAEMLCRNDELGTPLTWKLNSTFTDTALCPVPELTVTCEGRLDGGEVHEVCNGSARNYIMGHEFTTVWSVFDLAQRWKRPIQNFAVLDGLLYPKQGRVIGKRAQVSETISTLRRPLSCVHLLGSGMLPYDFWIDEHRRVLMAFSGAIMYILDDEAENKTAQLVGELMQGGVHYEY